MKNSAITLGSLLPFLPTNTFALHFPELERYPKHLHRGIPLRKPIQRDQRPMGLESFQAVRILRTESRSTQSATRRRRRVHQSGSGVLQNDTRLHVQCATRTRGDSRQLSGTLLQRPIRYRMRVSAIRQLLQFAEMRRRIRLQESET